MASQKLVKQLFIASKPGDWVPSNAHLQGIILDFEETTLFHLLQSANNTSRVFLFLNVNAELVKSSFLIHLNALS